jgi:exonuclease I
VPRLPDGLPALRLFEACTGLGIDVDEAHDALADAWLTAQLWQWQLHALAAAGITRLGQL